jgi:hypothetical protein
LIAILLVAGLMVISVMPGLFPLLVSGGSVLGIPIGLWVFSFVIVISVGLLLCMILFAFPAAAIDDSNVDIIGSIQLTAGNRWRMLWIFLFGLLIPAALADAAFIYIFVEIIAPDVWLTSIISLWLVLLTWQLLNFLGIAVGATLLSSIYRQLSENVGLPEEPSAPPPKTTAGNA